MSVKDHWNKAYAEKPTEGLSWYQSTLENSLSECGRGVIATFALDGPKRCSGLPVVRYGPEKMRAFLGSRFQLLDFVRETHVTPGGVGQSFIFFRFRRRN